MPSRIYIEIRRGMTAISHRCSDGHEGLCYRAEKEPCIALHGEGEKGTEDQLVLFVISGLVAAQTEFLPNPVVHGVPSTAFHRHMQPRCALHGDHRRFNVPGRCWPALILERFASLLQLLFLHPSVLEPHLDLQRKKGRKKNKKRTLWPTVGTEGRRERERNRGRQKKAQAESIFHEGAKATRGSLAVYGKTPLQCFMRRGADNAGRFFQPAPNRRPHNASATKTAKIFQVECERSAFPRREKK